jgi:phage terminase large subunit-like protein
MEYEKRNHCTVRVPNTDHIIWTDHRQNEGELLAPDRYTPENIAFFKKSMGANNYSALFQGRPTAETGGVFEKEWFNVWTESFLPPFELTLQCWDTAVSTTAEASYSCATTYGVFIHQGERHLMLISMFLDKLEYPDLKAMVLRMSRSYEDSNFYASPVPYRAPPTYTIIENKSSGQCLLSDLKRMGVQAIGYNPPSTSGGQYGLPGEGKIVRARMRSPVVKENRVWVRGLKDGKLMRMSETFLHACATFPNSGEGNMDIVDTFSMALDWLDRHKYFMPTGDMRSRDELRSMMKHFENSSFPAAVDNIPNANIRGMFDNFQLPEFKK